MIRMKVNIEWIEFILIHKNKVKVKYEIKIEENNHNNKPS